MNRSVRVCRVTACSFTGQHRGNKISRLTVSPHVAQRRIKWAWFQAFLRLFGGCMSLHVTPNNSTLSGVPPLGYRAQDRKLVIIDSEAEIVRSIFHRYAELGSVRLLKDELE